MKIKTNVKYGSILLLWLCAYMVPSAGYAQSEEVKNSTPEERAQRLTNWMKTELQLSSEQEASVHQINLKYAQQNESLRDDSMRRTSKYRKWKSSNNAKDKELMQVLTDAQFKTYQTKKSEAQKLLKSEIKERQN